MAKCDADRVHIWLTNGLHASSGERAVQFLPIGSPPHSSWSVSALTPPGTPGGAPVAPASTSRWHSGCRQIAAPRQPNVCKEPRCLHRTCPVVAPIPCGCPPHRSCSERRSSGARRRSDFDHRLQPLTGDATPERVVARMDEAMQAVGRDGFLISTPFMTKNRCQVAKATEWLVPALRRRGAGAHRLQHVPAARDAAGVLNRRCVSRKQWCS
jgi:hypothetical protein